METRCGIDFSKKLANKTPYERFDYIRLSLIRELKAKSSDTKHLDLVEIRKKIGLTAAKFKTIQGGVVDYEVFKALAEVINEEIQVLLEGHDERITGAPQEVDTKLKEIEKKAKKIVEKAENPPVSEVKSKRLGIELVFENCCPFNLSLEIDGSTIKIYENIDAPSSARHPLVGKVNLKIGGKDISRTFPETIKI